MESLQSIKQRIKGVRNINQITKAMELVAATKMRRSQEVALQSRPYAFTALDLLANLTRIEGGVLPPLLSTRPITKRLYVVVTSDKGLAGSFNSAVLRDFEKFVVAEQLDLRAAENSFVAIGQKALAFLERRTGNLVRSFTRVGDFTTVGQVAPIADFIIEGYLKENWDEVTIFSTHFRTALKQEVICRKVLPVDLEAIRQTARQILPETGRYSELRPKDDELERHEGSLEYIIEPSPEKIVEELGKHLILTRFYQIILEANASEHAARRMAMKNASDNAENLAQELTMAYNKSRQASITKEIIEIVAGAEAM